MGVISARFAASDSYLGLIPQGELQAMRPRFYPGNGIAGDYREGRTYRSPIATLENRLPGWV